jgi:HPt (histidine-containing phosphotransfer) domain-containing protein
MKDDDADRTASLMTPARLAQLRMKPAKPAASPTAYLDQLAADAGSGHVRRLVELRAQLEQQARERNYNGVAGALEAVGGEVSKLDFALLQPKGWLARAAGKGKAEGAGFAAQVGRIGRRLEDLAEEFQELQKRHAALSAVTERTLVEFDVEERAIDRIIDQGARWLQDMRAQLKTRQFSGPDAEAQKAIDEDNKRCELLVARLKSLGFSRSAAQHAKERVTLTVGKREGALAALQQMMDGEVKTWRARLLRMAEEAEAGATGLAGLDAARGAHEELERAIKQASRDCNQLQFYEKDLVDELAALEKPLQNAV